MQDRLQRPPLPWPHAGPPNLGACGWGFGVKGVAGYGAGCHGGARDRSGGCAGALAGGLMVGGSCIVYCTPPFLPHVILIEKNLSVGGERLPDILCPSSMCD